MTCPSGENSCCKDSCTCVLSLHGMLFASAPWFWLRSRADALNKSDGFLFPAVLGLQLFESWNGPVQRDCRGST